MIKWLEFQISILPVVVHDMYSRFVIILVSSEIQISFVFTNSGHCGFSCADHRSIDCCFCFKSIRCVAINYGFFFVSQSSYGETMGVMGHQTDLRITRSVITLALGSCDTVCHLTWINKMKHMLCFCYDWSRLYEQSTLDPHLIHWWHARFLSMISRCLTSIVNGQSIKCLWFVSLW